MPGLTLLAGLGATVACARPGDPARESGTVAVAAARLPLETVLAADSAFAAVVRSTGIAQALRRSLDASAVLVYPGANVMRGRDAIIAALQDVPLDSVQARAAVWRPRSGSVADDGSLAMSWGLLEWRGDSAGRAVARAANYLATWAPADSGWQLAGLVMTDAPSFVRGAAMLAPFEPPPGAMSSHEIAMWEADVAFARMASDSGAPAAFARFAAPNGFTFASPGVLRRGPGEIRAGLAAGPAADASWEWRPVFARGSTDGSLGFTVGDAVISPPAEGPLQRRFFSKYLTVWRRQPDGSYRYLADAGNDRPGG